MRDVFTDPEKIRGFTHALRGYMSTTNDSISKIQMQLGRLGDTWQDQEYRRFVDEFRSTQALLSELNRVLESVIPRLAEDAERAEAIHR